MTVCDVRTGVVSEHDLWEFSEFLLTYIGPIFPIYLLSQRHEAPILRVPEEWTGADYEQVLFCELWEIMD